MPPVSKGPKKPNTRSNSNTDKKDIDEASLSIKMKSKFAVGRDTLVKKAL